MTRIHYLGMNLFLYVSLALFAIGFSDHNFLQTDLQWQIRTGYDIVTTGSPPHADTYSWTRFGTPWAVNEWLTFALLYGFFKAFNGFAGAWIFQSVMLMAIAGALFFFVNRTTKSPLIASLITFTALMGAGRWFQPRPFLFTYLFIIITVGLCVEVKQGMGSSKKLWILPFCFAAWANFHQGVAVGIGILALFGFGDAIEAFWRKSKEPDEFRRLRARSLLFLSVAAAGFLASLLTPYNIQLYKLVLLTITDPSVTQGVNEWQPITYMFQGSDNAFLNAFLCLMLASAYCLIRYPKARSLGDVLVFAILLYQGVNHRRNEPILVLATAVVTSPALAVMLRGVLAWASSHILRREALRVPTWAKWTVVCLIFGWAIVFSVMTWLPILQLPQPYPPIEKIARYEFATDSFPNDAAGFVRHEQFPANMRMFNDYNLGGFLIFNCPTIRVFVDGRDDIYRGQILDHVMSIDDPITSQADLKEADQNFLRSCDLDCVFTDNYWVGKFYAHEPGWTIVYFSTQVDPSVDITPHRTWIYVRNRPQFSALISRCRAEIAARNNGQPPASGF